jgi:hypothetical protein
LLLKYQMPESMGLVAFRLLPGKLVRALTIRLLAF